MRVMTCPELRIVETLAEGIVVEHPYSTAQHALATPIAQLLELLKEPEELSALSETLSEDLIEQLLSIGLLVNADAPYETLRRLLRPFDPTFLAAPTGDPGGAEICVIGMPSDLLSDTGRGAASGPATLRLASTPPRYRCDPLSGYPAGWYDYAAGRHVLQGVRFADCGDIPLTPGSTAAEAGALLATIVRACRKGGSLPLILGGDHSLTYWAVKGMGPGSVAVLHLDAHSDMGFTTANNLEVPSNGSVVRALLGEENVAALVTVGLRGFLPWQETPLREGHTIISRAEYPTVGIDGVLAALPPELPLYISLDADCLDPSLVPACNSTVPGGFSYEEVRSLLDAVGRKRKVIGIDLVEVNGERDPHLTTSRVLVHLALSLLGACTAEPEA